MSECERFESLIDRAHSGEISAGDREALLDHLDICPACSDVFDAVRILRSDACNPEPGDLHSMRDSVMREIRRTRVSEPRRIRWPAFLRPAAAAAGICFLALGFLLGGGARKFGGREAPAELSQEGFTSAIKTVAQSHTAYEDVVDSPFTYTNVRLRPGEDGTVNLSFDVSRHLDLALKRNDPLVTEVLIQSLMEPSAVDTRLTAISLAGDVTDPKIRKSLTVAMLQDENLAVRMAAQSALAQQRADAELLDAFLTVLEREPSVAMRLAAIDYLANSQIQPERLEKAVKRGRPEDLEAVLVSASRYLNR